MSECRLYLITPPRLDDPRAFVDPLSAALDAGDVAAVQLRLKDIDDAAILRAADMLRPIVQQRGAAFIMNDRPELAVKAGCDGVHVGQDDTPYREARAALGDERTVGVTCHDSRHLAMEAADAGADYVAFGAFFPTATKDPKTHADIEIIRWWHDLMVVPCVAIGGITVENCAPLIEAGADFLAVSAGVWNHEGGPAVAVQRFNEVMGG